MTIKEDVDVVVAGGGPVGLFLAGELRLAGASVAVVERLAAPSQTIKAGSIGPQSVELFDRRGLLAPLQEEAAAMLAAFIQKNAPTSTVPAPAVLMSRGHFSGLWLLRGAPEARTAAMGVPQISVEIALNRWAVGLGADVRRGHELVGIDAGEDGVRVNCVADGRDVALHARYVVGCDGGRSTVRKLAGFDFPGTEPTITGRQALVEMAQPNPLQAGWHHTGRGMVVFGPGRQRILTVEFDRPPADRDTPVTAEEIQGSLRRVSGTDVTVTGLHSATRWTDNTRQADTYRRGRVLLAGDAAHVHPPFGGQGLNLGFQDAANLGWKLAADVAGWAPDGLLDTYTTERHPAAARALANTRAQVALMRPDPQTTAMRELFAELMAYDDANAHVSRMMSSLDIAYDVDCAHPCAGMLVADRELVTDDGPTRLFELQRDGGVILVDTSETGAAASIADPWADRIRVVRAKVPGGAEGGSDGALPQTLLVRPDGVVVWAQEPDGPPDGDGLVAVLERWWGRP